MKNKSILKLKITLLDIKPTIWRRVLVEDTMVFDKLHAVIQKVMGWDNCHMYDFSFGPELRISNADEFEDNWGAEEDLPAAKTKLSKLIDEKGIKFLYNYDFGDGWRHQILVEDILDLGKLKETSYPVCLDGKRACPPEDCGGSWGYMELIEALKDPEDDRHDEMSEWVSDDFDPEHFSVNDANLLLRPSKKKVTSSKKVKSTSVSPKKKSVKKVKPPLD
ncbi:MAG: plasmid pRiA4b ORF-3 family protein [Oligoflexia bacterium]|nr:plasmid pRiA4b ORF-3 family protein [Oligoflexia bacterium]